MALCDFPVRSTLPDGAVVLFKCNVGTHVQCLGAGDIAYDPRPGVPWFCEAHAALDHPSPTDVAAARDGTRQCRSEGCTVRISDGRRVECTTCRPVVASPAPHATPRARGGRVRQPLLPPAPRPPRADYEAFAIPWDAMLAGLGDDPAAAIDAMGDELALFPPPTVQHIPRGARSAITIAYVSVCEAAVDASPTAGLRPLLAWTVLFFFTHWLLCSSPPRHEEGADLTTHLRVGVDMLAAGDLAGLRRRVLERKLQSAAGRAHRAAMLATMSPDDRGELLAALRAQRAQSLVLGGEVRRGVFMTERRPDASDGAPPADIQEYVNVLRGLHPPAPAAATIPADYTDTMAAVRAFTLVGHALPIPLLDGAPDHEADGAALLDALRKCRGKSGGLDTMTADLLYPLHVDSLRCQRATMGVLRAIQDGRLPEPARRWLAAARLIGLLKSGPGEALALRPIAIAPLMRRLAGSLLGAHYRADIEAAVGPTQYGLSRNGREAVYGTVDACLRVNPSWVVLELDIKNAFNEGLREAMLSACLARLPPQLVPYARAFYVQHGDLFYRAPDGSVHRLSSQRGSLQGDPFGGILFDAMLAPILEALSAAPAFAGLVHCAFQDNIYLVGPAPLAAEAAIWLRAQFTLISLTLKPEKYHAWSPTPLCHDALLALRDLGLSTAQIAAPDAGLIVLGAPLGGLAYMATQATAATAASLHVLGLPSFRRLAVQAQWLALFFSVSRRPGHLARFVPPAALVDAEGAAASTLAQYLAFLFSVIPADQTPSWHHLLALPLRCGGMGIRAFERVPAFVAGTLAGRDVVRRRLTGADAPASLAVHAAVSASTADAAFLSAVAAMRAVETRVAAAHAAVVARCSAGRCPAPTRRALATALDDFDAAPAAALQHHLSSIMHDDSLNCWLLAATPAAAVRRLGCTGPGAAAWLVTCPGYRPELAWPGDTFRTAVQLHMGCDLRQLRDAGIAADGAFCWLRRVPAVDDDASSSPPTGGARPAGDGVAAAAAAAAAGAAADADAAIRPSPGDGAPRGAPVGSPVGLRTPTTRASREGANDVRRCGKHTVQCNGHGLFRCTTGGFITRTHNAIGDVLASIAPSLPAASWPGAARCGAVSSHKAVAARARSIAPRLAGKWACADVAIPQRDGTTMFIDARFTSSVTAAIDDAAPSPAFCAEAYVAAHLRAQEAAKVRHYTNNGALAAGGPMAPGVGSLVAFVVDNGGRLSPAAQRVLRTFAQAAAGDAPSAAGGTLSRNARTLLRSYHSLLSTTVHKWLACIVHQAAEWRVEDTPASPLTGATPFSVIAGPSMRRDPSLYSRSLADVDSLGLDLAGDVAGI